MKPFFKEIFQYHNHFNQKLRIEIKKHYDVLPESTFPLFCHILNAHHIWNARILNQPPHFTVWQRQELEACEAIDNANYTNTLKAIDSCDFDRVIGYKTSKGDEFANTIRDILFHVVNHSTHHKGQIISDFRRLGIDPIITDYIFYKR